MPDASIHGIEFEVRGNADSAASSVKKLSESLSHLRSAASGQKSSLKSIAGGLKSIASVAKQGAASLASFGKNLLLSPLKTATKNMAAFAKRLSTVAAGFKRILGYRLIRTLIKEIGKAFKEGTQNLYQYSSAIGGTFAANMNDAATSMLYFKNSIGAAWSPLMNLLAPAIRVVTDAAVALLNVLNQLIALLTGASGWTRATRKATEYGEAVGGAGGAAKEALKYLAPFDELNVLPDDKKGGGGGGGNLGYDDMFEEMTEFESGLADFANRIRDAIERADWQGLGQILGDKVNDLVDMVPWGEIGTKVGSKINAFFTTRYWTLETINFQNIGANVAELLNHAFEEIDFEIIGRGLTQKLTNLGDFIVGAVSNADWQLIGESVGNLVRGAFDQVSDWLENIDWSEFGGTLYTALHDAIVGIDFASLAESLFRLLGSALGASVSLLSSFVEEACKDIGEYFVEHSTKYVDMGDTWYEKGALAVAGFLEGVYDGMVAPVVNVGESFLESFFAGLGLDYEGGQAKAEAIITATVDLQYDQQQALTGGIWDWLTGGEATSNEINKALSVNVGIEKAGWDTVTGWIKSAAQWGSDTVAKGISLLKDGWTSVTGWIKEKLQWGSTLLDAAISLIQDGWTSVTGWIYQKFWGDPLNKGIGLYRQNWDAGNIAGWIYQKFWGDPLNKGIGLYKQGWSNVWNWIKQAAQWGQDSAQKRIELIRHGWQTVTHWLKLAAQWGQDKLEAAIDLIQQWSGTVADWVRRNVGIGSVTVPVYTTSAGGAGRGGHPVEASGGVFANGAWHSITQYASGGLPAGSQLFWAREAGPELVGTLGGHTAVMNNDQIVASVSAGVARAISSIRFHMTGFETSQIDETESEDIMYRAFRRALAETDFGGDVHVSLDGDPVYSSVVKRNREETYRTGVNPMLSMA